MTIQNAQKIIQIAIEYSTNLTAGIEKLSKDWEDEPHGPKNMAVTIMSLVQDYTRVLESIQAQLATKCRHPKKYRDRTGDGVSYCMNCNTTL